MNTQPTAHFKAGDKAGVYKLMSGPSEYVAAKIKRVRARVIDVEAADGRNFTFAKKSLREFASRDKNNPRRLMPRDVFEERFARLQERRAERNKTHKR